MTSRSMDTSPDDRCSSLATSTRCPAPLLPFLHRPASRSLGLTALSAEAGAPVPPRRSRCSSGPSPADGLDFLGHRLSPVDRTTFCYTPKGGGAIQAASRPQEMRAFVCSRPVHSGDGLAGGSRRIRTAGPRQGAASFETSQAQVGRLDAVTATELVCGKRLTRSSAAALAPAFRRRHLEQLSRLDLQHRRELGDDLQARIARALF
jgi:hypothetical protein